VQILAADKSLFVFFLQLDVFMLLLTPLKRECNKLHYNHNPIDTSIRRTCKGMLRSGAHGLTFSTSHSTAVFLPDSRPAGRSSSPLWMETSTSCPEALLILSGKALLSRLKMYSALTDGWDKVAWGGSHSHTGRPCDSDFGFNRPVLCLLRDNISVLSNEIKIR